MSMSSLIPVIFAGGTGTRLWPLSRAVYPKLFLPLLGEHTLLQASALRLKAIAGAKKPIFVGDAAQRFLLLQQLQAIGIDEPQLLLEPVMRSTGPASCISALMAIDIDEEAVLLLMPADHVIQDEAGFGRCVEQAMAVLADDKNEVDVVTFGVRPEKVNTGYGYLQCGEAMGDAGVSRLIQFKEKPNQADAERFLADGNYLWNSGLFLVKASNLLNLFERMIRVYLLYF